MAPVAAPPLLPPIPLYASFSPAMSPTTSPSPPPPPLSAETVLARYRASAVSKTSLPSAAPAVLAARLAPLKRLRHPALQTVYEVLMTDSGVVLVAEDFACGRLDEALGRGDVGEEHVLGVCRQVVGAVAYLHWHGIVHGRVGVAGVGVTAGGVGGGRVVLADVWGREGGEREDVRALGEVMRAVAWGAGGGRGVESVAEMCEVDGVGADDVLKALEGMGREKDGARAVLEGSSPLSTPAATDVEVREVPAVRGKDVEDAVARSQSRQRAAAVRAGRENAAAVAVAAAGGKFDTRGIGEDRGEESVGSRAGDWRGMESDLGLIRTADWESLVGSLGNGGKGDGLRGGSAEFAGLAEGSGELIVSERTKQRRREERLAKIVEIIQENGGELLDACPGTGHGKRKRAGHVRAEDVSCASAGEHELRAVKSIEKAAAELDFEKVLDLIHTLPQSVHVARAALKGIILVANDEYLVLNLLEDGVLEEVIGLLSRHEKDEMVALEYCRAISLFAKCFEHRVGSRMRALGVCIAVVGVMDDHKDSLEVQTEACGALGRICDSSHQNQLVLSSLRAPFFLHRALSRNLSHWKSADLAAEALSAFAKIAAGNEESCRALLSVCAFDAVSRTAEVFANENLEEHVLGALEAVMSCKFGREEIVKANGIHALSTVMMREGDHHFLLRCCKVVSEVCRMREAACLDEVHSSMIVENLVVCLRGTIGKEELGEVAFHGTQAIGFVAALGTLLRNQCMLVGAVETVAEVLTTRANDPSCVRMCAMTLATLIGSSEEAAQIAQRVGAPQVLRLALEQHGSIPSLTQSCRRTLSLLGFVEGDESEMAGGKAGWRKSPLGRRVLGDGSTLTRGLSANPETADLAKKTTWWSRRK